jgi:hypothetical protein
MAQAAHHRFTFDDYLRVEEDSGTKHEFVGGQVFAMSVERRSTPASRRT